MCEARVIRVRGIYEMFVLATSEEEAERGKYVKIPGTVCVEANNYSDCGEFEREDSEAIELLIELNKIVSQDENLNKAVLTETY